MNCKEWWALCSKSKSLVDFTYYNRTRNIQRSLQYNSDPSAAVIHHLRDTEEQRKYNNEHYELWGHNLDGTFEYGKYVIFVTEKEHGKIHGESEETRKKKSIANMGHPVSDETKKKISIANTGKTWSEDKKKERSVKLTGEGNPFYGKHHSQETKEKYFTGENNPMYGKHLSDKAKKAISEANKNKVVSDETRKKLSVAVSCERNGMYGKRPPEGCWNRAKELQEQASVAYRKYKEDGGSMKWQDFRREFMKEHR